MRAELFSTDFIISMMLFLSILIILGVYYENLQTDIYEYNIRSDMQTRAMNIADVLATSSGMPEFWNSSNVKVIGLFDSGKFNLTKIEQLMSMNYETVRRMMGTGVYDLYISLKNESGYIIDDYSFGSSLSDVKEAIAIKRLGIVKTNGEVKKVILEVIIWLKEV